MLQLKFQRLQKKKYVGSISFRRILFILHKQNAQFMSKDQYYLLWQHWNIATFYFDRNICYLKITLLTLGRIFVWNIYCLNSQYWHRQHWKNIAFNLSEIFAVWTLLTLEECCFWFCLKHLRSKFVIMSLTTLEK